MNNKNLAIVLILIMAVSSLSLLMVKPASAQSIPKPSVPEFTLKYVDYSYDVPPTYGIDQFTGKNVIINNGYHIDNRTIVFKVKNQHFTSHTDSNGNVINLYYNFKGKGHFGDQWSLFPFSNEPSYLYPSTNGQSTWRYSDNYPSGFPEFSQSNSDYTEFTFPLRFFHMENAPLRSDLDFEVQAMIGHIEPITTGPIAGDGFFSFTGQFGDWSNTQTITIADGSVSTSTSPNPTQSPTNTISPTPSIPELSWLVIVPLLISVSFSRKMKSHSFTPASRAAIIRRAGS